MSNWYSKTLVESIGIGAVVISLIFVGLELRQTSSTARLEAHQVFITAMSARTGEIASDPVLAGLIMESFTEKKPEEYTSTERMQLRSQYMSVTYLCYGLFLSVEEGILPEKYLSTIAAVGLYNSDYFRSFWPTIRTNYNSEFNNYFESLSWNAGN